MDHSKPQRSRYERLPRVCVAIFIGTAFCAILTLLFRLFTPFADAFNAYISQPLRILLAWITHLLPFSLAEAMLLFSPVLLILLIWHAVRRYSDSWRAVGMYFLRILAVACVVFIIFVLVFNAGYFISPLEHESRLDLDRQDVSADDLYATAVHLAEAATREAEDVHFRFLDFSAMPYTVGELNDKLMDAYDKFCAEHDFITHFESRVKPVMLSEPMSYTHITGVYSFFTGEANLNVNFPDYTLPFTAAHELAHQRGIAREDEANFVAYLVCIGSDDAYIRYSGYLTMYEYVTAALYEADRDLYYDAREPLPNTIRGEQWAYSAFFDQYRDSVASEVTGSVNDTYLKLQGTEGTKSYGLVVDLAVAYDKKLNE